jgi:hypothetical protein
MSKNLYRETVFAITDSNHTIDDISWIGTYAFCIDTDQFFKIAENTNYDSGFGSAEIPVDLMIVFTDGSSLRREEYDGSEWWRFYPDLKKPTEKYYLAVDSFTDYKYKYKDYLFDYVR